MSISNSPQTLFRFVSLRNPNLAENDEKNLRFVFRPSNIKGYFDSVSSTNQTKIQALITAANNFPDASKLTLNDLKNGEFVELLELGKIIAKDTELTTDQLSSAMSSYNTMKTRGDSIKDLWDNLIYQYLTQKDFYVKEAIAHILKAFHVGYVQSLTPTEELQRINGNDFTANALTAQIVFPFDIFQKENTSTSSKDNLLTTRESGQILALLENEENIQNKEADKTNFIQLKNELKSIQSQYNIQFEKAYKQAVLDYDNEYNEEKVAYENQLSVVLELEKSNATKEEIETAYNNLKSLEYHKFSFEYKNEVNWEDLLDKLTKDSLATFLEYYTNADQIVNTPLNYGKMTFEAESDENLSIDETFQVSLNSLVFDKILVDIDEKVANLTQEILNSSYLPQTEYKKIGSVLVPVSDRNLQTSPLSYAVKVSKPTSDILQNTDIGHTILKVQVENSSWSVDYATITAQTDKGEKKEILTNIPVVNNSLAFPPLLVNQFKTISDLEVQIFFSNGEDTTLLLENIVQNQPTTGKLVLNRTKPIDPTNNGTSNQHFGLKRLGIAEYMKVVQSVHAYVPGEVSDIENVMASELRHKSINELRRTEDTVTTSKTQETERISDTTKTDRSEMQTEVAKELEKQQSFQAHANFSYNGGWKIELGTAYATNNSQYSSNRQMVTKSQEITERAMERVQIKISEERITKIIHEISLTNVHEFDNRGGLSTEAPKHITGVYRWVDKKMKNQIYNYGKRTMFEFMIPEPAKLHRLANTKKLETIIAPVDPRKAPAPHTMANANMATNELLEYWAGIYGVNLTALLPYSKQIIHSTSGVPQTDNDFLEVSSFQITENYVGKNANFYGNSSRNRGGGWEGSRYSSLYCSNLKGDMVGDSWRGNVNFNINVSGLNLTDTVEFRVTGHNVNNYNVRATVNCELSTEYINAWKLENFNAIISAYQTAYDAYLEELERIEAEQQALEDEQKESQANFYRIIEADVLKHNCIAYLLQNYLTVLGQDFIDGDQMLNFKVLLNQNLDNYTAKAKFLEQAFEWTIMDYTFYPYYWADRNVWQELYLSESIDPLFRSFLQAGMARVIVTVKPGFEEAVQYFLTTGQVWMGGETPIIGDPLYVSISEEMRDPVGVPQGKYWITRIPTTLTILQDKSTGLEVTEPLPIFPESEPKNCENPEELETETAFTAEDIQLSASDRPSTLG